MSIFLTFLALFVFFAVASAQAGRSMAFNSWQDKIPFGHRIPEAIIGLAFALIALYGWDHAFNIVGKLTAAYPIATLNMVLFSGALATLVFLFMAFVAFVGKESATVYYLPGNWDGFAEDTNKDGTVDFKDGRKSTMRPFNDFIAKVFGIGLSSKWYPKIWAFSKGLLISLPIGGICAIFQPVTRHISIRAGEFMARKFKHSSNFYAEFYGDGTSYALGCTLFLYLTGII